MKRKSKWNMIYIFIFLVVASIGITNSLRITKGEFKPPIFYTTLSGLICFIYFFFAFINSCIQKDKDVKTFFVLPRLKGAVTICITVTFLVYHFLVYEGPILSIDLDIYNVIPHYIVPIMVILHYFIFDTKGIYKKTDPLLWLIIPLLYFTWANIKALLSTTPYWDGEWYPYGFIDLTKHSLQSVIITVLVLLAFFIVLGYALYFIDQKLKDKELLYTGDSIPYYK